MKIAHVYYEINMSNSHKGLRKQVKKPLPEDECAIFINKAWTGLKMLTPGNVILYVRQPNSRPIHPDTIKFLPNCVRGDNLNYPLALHTVIKSRFNKRYPGLHETKLN